MNLGVRGALQRLSATVGLRLQEKTRERRQAQATDSICRRNAKLRGALHNLGMRLVPSFRDHEVLLSMASRAIPKAKSCQRVMPLLRMKAATRSKEACLQALSYTKRSFERPVSALMLRRRLKPLPRRWYAISCRQGTGN